MKIENKEMLLYSMDKAIEEAMEATKTEDFEEVYYRIGTAVHWIVDCMDRAFACTNFNQEDKELRHAFHAANNALKHRCDLISLHKMRKGVTFPSTFPLHFGIHYDWADISDVKLNKEFQKEYYKKILYNRNIIPTFQSAKTKIHFYFDKSDKYGEK